MNETVLRSELVKDFKIYGNAYNILDCGSALAFE